MNQRLPSGPAAMPPGALSAVGIGNSVTTPAVVIRPILLPSASVNQRLPSGPAAMPDGRLLAVGIGNSVMTPAVVIRPILLRVVLGEPEVAVRAGRDARTVRCWPSEGRELGDDAGGVIRPILLASRFGEPEVAVRAGRDAAGSRAVVGIGNSVIV